jgi:hypothetical protein
MLGLWKTSLDDLQKLAEKETSFDGNVQAFLPLFVSAVFSIVICSWGLILKHFTSCLHVLFPRLKIPLQ